MTIYTHLESPLGEMLAVSQENKLTGLYFTNQAHVLRIGRDWVKQPNAEIFSETREQLEEFTAGERKTFDLPMGLSGTPFQVLVWNAIAQIPFGETITYSELAKRVGSPQGVRAVGAATGRNPVCWIVPCHRVVGKGGALTGYAGGIPRKQAFLEFEANVLAGREATLAVRDKRHAWILG